MNDYPAGKLNEADEGALTIKVAVTDGRVVIDFGKPVNWIGLTGNDALALAELLIERGREAGITMPVTIKVGG